MEIFSVAPLNQVAEVKNCQWVYEGASQVSEAVTPLFETFMHKPVGTNVHANTFCCAHTR